MRSIVVILFIYMNIIKLDAIDSTNDFLKKLSRNQLLTNFTVVSTLCQTKGRGQMGTVWQSEKGKNLTISILIKNVVSDITKIYDLNVAVSVAVFSVLQRLQITNLSIKWPNDIMAGDKKIGGILIENRIISATEIESVVGIGLNINQSIFPDLLGATSLYNLTGHTFDIDEIVQQSVLEIQQNCALICSKTNASLWQLYHTNLYKIDVPSLFKDATQNHFYGVIKGVNALGQLRVLPTVDQVARFYGIKEITIIS